MPQAININDLQLIVARVDKEIKFSPLSMGYDRLAKLGISVLTDLEYEDVFYKGLIRGGNAFAFNPDADPSNQKMGQLGAVKQRTMVTEIVKALIPDNLLAYRDKVPLGDGGRVDLDTLTYTNDRIEWVKNNFVADIVRQIFVGVRNEEIQDGYHAYDGLFAEIDKYIAKGEVSVGIGNMVPMPEITDDMDDLTVYNIMHTWRTQWNNNFQEHLEEGGLGVDWYLTKSIYDRFVEGYKVNYKHQNLEDVHKPGYTFIGWDGIRFHPTALMGNGSRMFVTIPDNLDMGLNTKANIPGVTVTCMTLDPTKILYHIMSAIGTRVRYIEPSCFICNDQTNTIISGLGVDYEKATIYVTSNNDEFGTVEADKPTDDVKAKTVITLTATANDGYQFKMWQDGSDVNPRTILAPGTPIAYQAIFVPAETTTPEPEPEPKP